MKLKIVVVDLEVSRRTKRVALLVGVPLALLAISRGVTAAVPYTFAPGDVLSSSAMNTNFSDLDARIAKARFVGAAPDGGATYSVGMTSYCGKTGPLNGKLTFPGKTDGYAAAKSLCETACKSPSAHMCLGEEVVRTAQAGQPAQSGWFAPATVSATAGPTLIMGDCSGWTLDTAGTGAAGNPNNFGMLWSGGSMGWTGCDQPEAVLCCD